MVKRWHTSCLISFKNKVTTMLHRLELPALSMLNRMAQMEAITNNLANISTKGFKRDRVFINSFFEKIINLQTKHKMPENSLPYSRASMDLSQGTLIGTERPLDVAISGEGFFVVETQQGEALTRDGRFTLNSEGLLTDMNGHPVMGEGGSIEINLEQADFSKILINESGEILLNGNVLDKLQIVKPQNPMDLMKIGTNLFRLKEPNQGLETIETPEIKQGFLEESNVNPLLEMVQMIEVMQLYRTDEKVIRSQDEMLRRAANNIGRIR